MEDLVTALRTEHRKARERGGDMMTFGEGQPLMVEAANEIERLRSEAAEIRRLVLELYTETTGPAVRRART